MEKRTIFVVDDDQGVQSYLFSLLTVKGYQVACFDNGDALLSRISSVPQPDLILLDVLMPGCDGVEVMQKVRALGVKVPIVMLSGLSDLRTVVESMKLGAANFLMKPFEEEALERVIDEAMPETSATANARRAKADEVYSKEFLTRNPKMLKMAGIVAGVAYTDVPILILGESGVGKEVLARFAHRQSGRRDKPFVKINCAALPHELLESELFGYEKGAFTGAVDDRMGKFEQAHTGTLLLDEIGEMSAHLQSKLLHVLQDGTFSRLGARKSMKVDVRIIAATNIKLEEAIAEGKFREDLYYRLNVVRIDIPSLRDRVEDIPRLCEHFVSMYREKYHSAIESIPAGLLQSFAMYDWPGNIRQLENLVKRYLLLGNAEEIQNDLSPRAETSRVEIRPVTAGVPESLLTVGAAAAERAERQLVEKTLVETNGNRKKAAQRLNISYKALLNKIKRWGGNTPKMAVAASNAGQEPT